MELQDLRRNWDGLGSADPLWAILTYPDRHGNKWTTQEFFATGEDWIARYDAILTDLGIAPVAHRRALDFGCGAGRLTRALGSRYAQVDGVDIAASMIELARLHHHDHANLTFHVNERADLALFDADLFDFIVSIIVFQHMNPQLIAGYLDEFVRVLAPGGVAMFNVPSHLDFSPLGLVRRVPNRLQNRWRRRRYGYGEVIELHTLARAKVEAMITAAGGVVSAVVPDDNPGRPFHTFIYVVTKPATQPG